MRTVAAVLARFMFVALPLGALDTYPRQPGINVEHYVFALELSDTSDEIRVLHKVGVALKEQKVVDNRPTGIATAPVRPAT